MSLHSSLGWTCRTAALLTAGALIAACGGENDDGGSAATAGGTGGTGGLPATGGTGDAAGTGGTSYTGGTGGGSEFTSEAAIAARCQARCDTIMPCPDAQEAFGTVQECFATCIDVVHPEVPAACEAAFEALETCRLGAYAVCASATEACASEAVALGDCIRAGDECHAEGWMLPMEQLSSTTTISQWACRCTGWRDGAAPGQPCATAEDCATVCCPCDASTVSWGLMACLDTGVCAGVEACATVADTIGDLCGP